MSRRLTDEELDSLEHSHGMIESEYTPTCRSAPYGNGCPGATDDTQDFWRRAADAVPSMIAELRQLRAQALTKEEREALGWAKDVLANLTPLEPKHRRLDAASALSRLLGKEEW